MKYILLAFCISFSMVASGQQKQTVTYTEGLQMDLYVPDNRPEAIVLFVHGGGFSGGTRADGDAFCRNVLDLNDGEGPVYAAITMSYRLLMTGRGFSCDIPAAEKKQVFLEAGRDISKAVAWILENGRKYGLDTDRIILAGSSAGAEAVLHAAFWDETLFDEEGSSIIPDDFRYSGLISMAGALTDLELITPANAIPSLLFHGTCDPLVPYASAPHHYCDSGEPGYLMLHGSASIADRLENLGANYSLVAECGAGHEWAGLPTDEYFKRVRFFLKGLLPNATEFSYREVISGEVNCDYPDNGECRG